MRTLRFYSPALAVGRIVLDPVESHHLIHVLRLKIGSEIELFDGRGNRASAVVAEIRKKEALVDVREVRCCAPLKPALILGVSIARGSRFDLVVEKCTGLGADHIAAVQFDRTVKLGKGESLERYRRIAVSPSSSAAATGCRFSLAPPLLTGRLGIWNNSIPMPSASTVTRVRMLPPLLSFPPTSINRSSAWSARKAAIRSRS